jgi:hypothetical protein
VFADTSVTLYGRVTGRISHRFAKFDVEILQITQDEVVGEDRRQK